MAIASDWPSPPRSPWSLAWFVVRTVAGDDGPTYLVWVVAAGVLALVAPRSGLIVFVATSVFFEPDSLARTLGPRELVLLPLALGVLIQIAADRFRWRPGLAIWLALLLLLGTALGVLHTVPRLRRTNSSCTPRSPGSETCSHR